MPPVIDAHIHIHFNNSPEKTSGIIISQNQLLKEMREAGVVGAVAHTGMEDGDNHDLNSKGIVNCAGLGAKVNESWLEAELKRGTFRCIKIYLGYVPQYANSPNYEAAYHLAAKYSVPVVFHTGGTYSADGLVKYADPITVDEVAVKHRKVNFVIAHCGQPWFHSAAAVAQKNSNVYLDGSGMVVGNFNDIPPEAIEEILVKPLRWVFLYLGDPTKLMYGTDWPLVPMKPYLEAFKRAIPQEHWQAVFHDNAARVFRMAE
jgi:uncharacterized protein